VDLDVEAGRITALIGPNGAGKTTTFNVITGLQETSSGSVILDGKPLNKLPPHQRARRGIGRTFQRLEVFGSLSVHDNILAAAEFHKGWARDGSKPKEVAREIIERIGLRAVEDSRVEALPTGHARLVELGRALATRPKLLLLDEPGSGLNSEETEELGDLLIQLADEGIAVLLVEHDVELVMRVCDLIYVLDFGKIIAVGTPVDVQRDPAVQAAYLGTDTSLTAAGEVA
jgi:branched-chain amino acid transport system ATP-binding protein